MLLLIWMWFIVFLTTSASATESSNGVADHGAHELDQTETSPAAPRRRRSKVFSVRSDAIGWCAKILICRGRGRRSPYEVGTARHEELQTTTPRSEEEEDGEEEEDEGIWLIVPSTIPAAFLWMSQLSRHFSGHSRTPESIWNALSFNRNGVALAGLRDFGLAKYYVWFTTLLTVIEAFLAGLSGLISCPIQLIIIFCLQLLRMVYVVMYRPFERRRESAVEFIACALCALLIAPRLIELHSDYRFDPADRQAFAWVVSFALLVLLLILPVSDAVIHAAQALQEKWRSRKPQPMVAASTDVQVVIVSGDLPSAPAGETDLVDSGDLVPSKSIDAKGTDAGPSVSLAEIWLQKQSARRRDSLFLRRADPKVAQIRESDDAQGLPTTGAGSKGRRVCMPFKLHIEDACSRPRVRLQYLELQSCSSPVAAVINMVRPRHPQTVLDAATSLMAAEERLLRIDRQLDNLLSLHAEKREFLYSILDVESPVETEESELDMPAAQPATVAVAEAAAAAATAAVCAQAAEAAATAECSESASSVCNPTWKADAAEADHVLIDAQVKFEAFITHLERSVELIESLSACRMILLPDVKIGYLWV